MLLDRAVDTFLAHRSDADGWLIKPLDAFRLRQATKALLDGGTWFEGNEEPEPAAAAAPVDEPEPEPEPPPPPDRARRKPVPLRLDPSPSVDRPRNAPTAGAAIALWAQRRASGTIASPYGL